MRAVAIFSLFIALVAGICFDNGDCLLTPKATCSKTKGGFLGSCVVTATNGGGTKTTTAVSATATGSTCFDDGDCILSGGKCVKKSGSITGKCTK